MTRTTGDSGSPSSAGFDSRQESPSRWPLILITASQFVLQLDFSIVNVALPTLAQELHLNPARLQWMVTGYALTFGSLLLLGGRIGDRFGHRRILLLGLILFGVTSLGAGLAQNAPELIFARFAQGASAALVAPQALASLTDLYRDGPGRSQALGIFQGASAAGASAGIVLGGLLTEYVGWRAVFLVNPPIIVAMVVVMHRVLPSVPSVDRNRLDVLGATVSTASLASLIYGLSEGQQQGFTAPAALCALVASALLAVTFVIVERRQSHPILPFQIFADPARRAALTVMLLMGGVVAGYVYFASLYLQGVLRFSAVLTGVALIPATAIVLLTSVLLTPKLLARHSVKTLLLAGLVSTGLGQLWLTSISTHGSYLVNVCGGLLLTSFGMGLAFPAAAVAVTAGVATSDGGLASSLYSTAQQVGSAVGLAALATVAAARTAAAGGSPTSGYRLAFVVSVCIVGVALLLVALLFGNGKQAEVARRPAKQ